MSGRLDGKVALAMGAGSLGPGWGNGRAIAVRFSQEGAKVFAIDRDMAHAGDCALGELFTGRERDVLQLTDTMTRDIEVPAALFESVQVHFDAQAMIDLTVTIAAYNMVSRFLVALQIGH